MDNTHLTVGGVQNGSPPYDYPPSYHSDYEGDIEKNAKEPEVDTRPIQFLKTRATTFTSMTGKEVKDKYGKAKRFITRSGTGLSEIHYATARENRGYIRRRFSGWKGGVLASAISVGGVLLVNFVFTIWAAVTSKSGTSIGVIWEADCETIHTADVWIHVIVNLLGTVLLGSSNYTMQCLSSPTRKEVDAAHSVGKFLDIGLPSFRNLRGWRKKTLFGLLVASTVPLHFLWNSAVFTTSQQLDYQVYVVTPNFFKHDTVDCSQNVSVRTYGKASPSLIYMTPLEYTSLWNNNLSYSNIDWSQADTCSTAKGLLANATKGTLERLSNEECVKAYGPGDSHMSRRGNVLAVTKNQPPGNVNATILLTLRYEYFVSNYTGNNWVCDPAYINTVDRKCDWRQLAKTANTSWNLGSYEPLVYSYNYPTDYYTNYSSYSNYTSGIAGMRGGSVSRTQNYDQFWEFPAKDQWPIDYCLSQTTDLGGRCKLQYSLIIMICVLISNAIKFTVIFYFLRTSLEPVLATIGDGISSFLERPDPTTKSYPFLNRRDARNFKHLSKSKSSPTRYQKPHTLRWWHAPSLPRWTITLLLCTAAIIVTGILLHDSVRIAHPFASFGSYNEEAVLNIFSWPNNDLDNNDFTSNSNLISMVAVANIPQVLVSCLYFAYNTVYTSMVSADEWSRFSVNRKTLRTTDPMGSQRSTYWLSLPWTYALPLAGASSMLHWLISQALFVARTEVLSTEGVTEPVSYMAVGYSPLGILLALLFGTAMVIGMVINGAKKLKGGILVGNNSLAIAAACQRPEKDFDAHMKPVMWGALFKGDGRGGKDLHCTFTSEEVEPPTVGELYI